jgi:hypothetical protein
MYRVENAYTKRAAAPIAQQLFTASQKIGAREMAVRHA